VPVQPQRVANPERVPSFSLLDPMKRFGVRRRSPKPIAVPNIRLLGGDDPIVPFFRRPEPEPPPPPSQDDPLETRCINRRLEALGRALEDLPGQARRFARWQARIEASSMARTDEKPRAEQSQPRSDTQGKRRFRRAYPMRPGRPPGWRRKPDHEVYEVLRDLHGLAVWAGERPDTS
jgi:hypothetical protein